MAVDVSALTNFFAPYFDIIWAAAVVAISFVAAKTINFVLKRWAVKLTAKTKSNLDDMLIKALRWPITLGFVLAGLYIGITSISYLLPHYSTITQAFSFIQIFFTAFVIARIVNTIFDWYARDVAAKTQSKLDDHMLPALKKAVYLIVFLVAIVFFMRGLGVEITALIAALGIGGLAIALALQDTLSNFFAGAYTTLDKPIRVNDFVQIETGEKGYVQEIGWRTTKIRQLDGNTLIIPNAKLAQNRIINFDLENPHMSVGLACGVAYDSDLDKVEKISIEVAKGVMKEHAGISDFQKYPPSVRFSEFGDSNIKFNLWFTVKKATDQFKVKHEMIKALKKRLDREGIVIEYPVTKVYLGKEKTKRKR